MIRRRVGSTQCPTPSTRLVHRQAAQVAAQQLVKVKVAILVAHAAALAAVPHVDGLKVACRKAHR